MSDTRILGLLLEIAVCAASIGLFLIAFYLAFWGHDFPQATFYLLMALAPDIKGRRT